MNNTITADGGKPAKKGDKVTVGSRWMARTPGKRVTWIEVTILDLNVPRKEGLRHRVRLAYSPMSARWYIHESNLRPIGHPDTKPALSIIDDGPHILTEDQWSYLQSKKAAKKNG